MLAGVYRLYLQRSRSWPPGKTQSPFDTDAGRPDFAHSRHMNSDLSISRPTLVERP